MSALISLQKDSKAGLIQYRRLGPKTKASRPFLSKRHKTLHRNNSKIPFNREKTTILVSFLVLTFALTIYQIISQGSI